MCHAQLVWHVTRSQWRWWLWWSWWQRGCQHTTHTTVRETRRDMRGMMEWSTSVRLATRNRCICQRAPLAAVDGLIPSASTATPDALSNACRTPMSRSLWCRPRHPLPSLI
ncbi:hypothetical protein IWZ00DRAFT_502952 [Phyllosticta capitalensis]